MKKLLLATAIAAMGLGTAQAAPTVYGKLHATVSSKDVFKAKGGNSKGDTDSVVAVDSFDSRIGVKGDEKLTDNLSAIYGIEWAVNADGDGSIGGSTSDLTQRNRFVGLKLANVGAVKVGRLDTHFKTAQGKVDIFNDMYTDLKAIMVGENRLNNVISLESDPKALEGIGINLMLIQAENNNLTANSKDKEKSFGSALSGSIVYDNKDMGVFASIAGDQNVPNTFSATGAAAETRAFRGTALLDLGAMADMEGLSIGALVQTAKPVNLSAAATALAVPATATTPAVPAGPFAATRHIDKENAVLVSGTYAIADTPWAVKAEYGQSTTSFKNGGTDIKQNVYGAMAEYKFNSKTRAYGYVSQLTNDQKVATIETADRTFGGLGMEYNF